MNRYRAMRGQVLPLVVLQLWVVAGVAVLVMGVGDRAVQQARAQAGADAVALSEAAVPGSGLVVAARNRVTIELLDRTDGVQVVVGSGPARAAARAQMTRPTWEGLDPLLMDALGLAEALVGMEVTIESGYRSSAEQQRLWDSRADNPYPVAAPGSSLHERGLAVDVALHQAGRLAQIARLTGLCQPLPLLDPVHFILCRTTPTR